jgi:hypothetical protein
MTLNAKKNATLYVAFKFWSSLTSFVVIRPLGLKLSGYWCMVKYHQIPKAIYSYKAPWALGFRAIGVW